MTRARFRWAPWFVSTAVIITAAFNMAGQEKPPAVKIEAGTFTSAAGDKVEAEFGRLSVPENRKAANSRKIELAFVRFKSTAAKPGPPIVYLAGGPGGSGIGAARGTRFPLFMAMREIGDVIALDQRGTGDSTPSTRCTEVFSFDPARAMNREDAARRFRELSAACAARLRADGVDLAGYNTNENADDIEALRTALGAEKVSLWSISYGTHLAFATVKRHEKKIHRLILAGTEGPGHTLKLPSSIQKHLENLDRVAKADAELSKEVPSLLDLIKTVLDEVDRKPVSVEITDPASQQKRVVLLSKFSMQLMTAFAFGTGEAQIPAMYYAMSKGDYSTVARRWLGFVAGNQGIGSGMSNMMDCFSGASAQRRRSIASESKTTLLGDAMNFPFPDACSAWGDSDLGEDFRKDVKTRVPALFISGTMDVRTPPSNAEEVRKGFSNSVHLIIDGAVHSDPLFLSSPKIKDVMLEFMRGEKVSTTTITIDPIRFAPLRSR